MMSICFKYFSTLLIYSYWFILIYYVNYPYLLYLYIASLFRIPSAPPVPAGPSGAVTFCHGWSVSSSPPFKTVDTAEMINLVLSSNIG